MQGKTQRKAGEAEPKATMRLPLLAALAACAAPAAANPQEEDELRQHRRLHVLQPASIESDDGIYDVKLRNLSCSGAMIEGARDLDKGAVVLFRRGLFELISLVVWREGNRAGLRFESPIDEGNLFVLSRRLPTPTPRQWFGYA